MVRPTFFSYTENEIEASFIFDASIKDSFSSDLGLQVCDDAFCALQVEEGHGQWIG
jgi:hypothetical protein